jgi:hypothetical protein
VANDKKLTNRLEMKISFHHLFFRPRTVDNCFPKEDPNRMNLKVFDFNPEQSKTSNAKFWTGYSISFTRLKILTSQLMLPRYGQLN